MDGKFEILENLTQSGLTTKFSNGKVRTSLPLKKTDGKKVCFSVEFQKASEYADFSHWLMNLLIDEKPLQAIELDGRIVAIGRGDDYVNNWFLSYKRGGGRNSTMFPSFIVRNTPQLY